MNRNASSFVADVILYLIGKIKYFKDKKFEPSPFIAHESEETQRRWVCTVYLTNFPNARAYGISRSTQYRRLKDLREAGIIELDRLKKCWIPTKEFYSEIVGKLLE